ncbi:MAG: SDR family NAD(P)-dependent oxidoreductase, partial [Nevskiales bacterium]
MPTETKDNSGRSWVRRLLIRTPFAHRIDLTGKRIIVTGASPGSIGYATARTLATWGASVVITARSTPEDSAASLRATLPPESCGRIVPARLDLVQADSVARFVQWYTDTQGQQLDVLVNNAGIHLDLLSQWKSPQLTADGFEMHWRINYLGSFDLTRRLLPLLLTTGAKSDDARTVNVVSMLHNKGRNVDLF